MKYIGIDRLELIASIERPTVELTAGYIMNKINPYITKIQEVIVPKLKSFAKRVEEDPNFLELVIDFSQLAVVLAGIQINPYISIMAAITLLDKIKDNPVMEEFPAFREFFGTLKRLEGVLDNFNKAYIVVQENKKKKLPVPPPPPIPNEIDREKQEKELKQKMKEERKRQEKELKEDRLQYVDTF